MSDSEALYLILEKITSLDEKITSLDEKVTSLDEKVSSLESELGSVRNELTDLRHGQDKMRGILDSVYTQTGFLSEFRTEANEKLDVLSSEFKSIEIVTKENTYDITKLKGIELRNVK